MTPRPTNAEENRQPPPADGTRQLLQWGGSMVGAGIVAGLLLVTFFFSLTGRIPIHRKVARWTFPIWLYVSVTGVIVYAMLAGAKG